jgi:hypothetical protein
VVPLVADSAAVTWTNMPAAATLFAGSHRHVIRADLTNMGSARLIVNKQATAGAAASVIELRYATSFSTSVGAYLQIGSSVVQCAVNTTNTVATSAWVTLTAAAKADVFLALVGTGGDGALDPTFGSIVAQFKP